MRLVLYLVLLWTFVCINTVECEKRKVFSSTVEPRGLWERVPSRQRSEDLDNESVSLFFALHQRNLDKLEKKFWEVSDPNHEDYGNHLSLDEMIDLIAPRKKESGDVMRWLSQLEAVEEVKLSPSGDYIEAKMSLRGAERLIETEFGTYRQSDRSGRSVLLIDQDYSLPERIGDLVELVQFKHTLNGNFEEDEEVTAEEHLYKSQYSSRAEKELNSKPIAIRFENFLVPETQDGAPILPLVNPVVVPVCLDGTLPTVNKANQNLECDDGSYISGFFLETSNLQGQSIHRTVPYSPELCGPCSVPQGRDPRCRTTLLHQNSYYRANFHSAVQCYPYQVTATFVPYITSVKTEFTMSDGSTVRSSSVKSGILENTLAGTPDTINKLYGIPAQAKSTNPKNFQAVFESLGEFFSYDDLKQYYKLFGLEDYSGLVSHTGKNNQSMPGGEGSLDIQLITAVGRGCRTEYEYYHTTNAFFQKWLTYLLNARSPPFVVSVSYGGSEISTSQIDKRQNIEFMKAGVRGITILVSSGDSGAFTDGPNKGPSVSFPASSPYVTSVGATQLSSMYSAQGTVSEVVCSVQNGSLITSGGGFSKSFDRPKYQDNASAGYRAYLRETSDVSKYHINGRIVPDVSALGHNLAIIIGGSTGIEDGTSASAPIFAGMVTLWNDIRLNNKKSTLGFINPFLYSLPTTAFNDVVHGSNNCAENLACREDGFDATVGFDAVTGLGTPKFDVIADIVAKSK